MAKLKISKKGLLFIIISVLVLVLVGLLGWFILSRTTTKTPIDLTRNYLKMYKNASSEVMDKIKYPYSDELTETQLAKFKELIKTQYLALDYEIVEENIGEVDAIIKVEFEVLDYKSSYEKADNYLSIYEKDKSVEKQVDYKLKEIEKTKEKIKYGIDFSFYKLNDKWEMIDVSNADIAKLSGTY